MFSISNNSTERNCKKVLSLIDFGFYFSSFPPKYRYPFVAYHRTTQLLAVGGRDSYISIYDLKQGQKIHDLNTKEAPPTKTSSFSFSLSSSVFYSSSGGGEGGKGESAGGGGGGEVDLDVALEGVVGLSFNEVGKIMAAFSCQDGQVFFSFFFFFFFISFSFSFFLTPTADFLLAIILSSFYFWYLFSTQIIESFPCSQDFLDLLFRL